MDRTAKRLLDAQVSFAVNRITGGEFEDVVRTEVRWALERADQLILDDVMDRAQVKAVAIKYVARFELPGAIPDIGGEIAARLKYHPAQEAALGEVVSRRHVEAVVAKVAEMPAVRQMIASRIADNPTVQAWLAQYLHGLATSPLVANRRIAQKLPGVSSALRMGERLAGGVVREADQMSRELADRTAIMILQRWRDGMADSLADDEFAEALMSLWDQLSERRISDALAEADEDDLVDLVAIVYELWLDLRHSDYLHSLIENGVDYIFDTYGRYKLGELIAEFGLGENDMVEEAMRFAPPVIAALQDAGLLEEFVRRQLEPFYASPEFKAAIKA